MDECLIDVQYECLSTAQVVSLRFQKVVSLLLKWIDHVQVELGRLLRRHIDMRTAVISTALCYLSTSLPWILLLSDIITFLDLSHKAHGIQVSCLACQKKQHELQLCLFLITKA